jgi:4-amino-4-deoxy-L-arabinose transferase-like glycosyltransferase
MTARGHHDDLDTAGAPWGRPVARWLVAVLLAGMVLGWFARQPALTTGGDEATYLILSESLAEGRYRDEFVLGTPRHAKYPPGMPLWLLALRTVGGESHDVPRAANLLLLALTALLMADAARRLVSPLAGVAVAAAIMFNPSLVEFAGSLLSETLFGLFIAMALWALLRIRGVPVTRHAALLAVLAVLAAFLTRSAGIALVGAVVVTLLLQHRRWITLVGAAILAGSAVAWIRYVRDASQHSLGRNYGSEVNSSVDIASGSGVLGHLVANARDYLVWVPSSQFGFPSVAGTGVDNLAWAALIVAPALVGLVLLARTWRAAALFVAAYGAMLLLWPFADGRLATPLLPTMLVAIAVGTAFLFGRLGAARPGLLAAGFLVTLASIGAVATTGDALRLSGCRRAPAYADPACHSGAQRDLIAAAKYAADSLPPDAIVATTHPAMLYLVSARRAVPWERLYDAGADSLLAPHGAVTHALVSQLGWNDLEVKVPWTLTEACTRARSIARFGAGTVLVSLAPADSTRGEPACPDLPAMPPP